MRLFFHKKEASYQTSVYEQNSADSITDSKGFYDFENFSDSELGTITAVLDTAKKKYPKKYQGIGLAMEAYSIVYKPRYVLNEIVIIKYGESNYLLDKLAVGLAYITKGAAFREKAFEYLEYSIPKLKKSDFDLIKSAFTKIYLYNTLTDLYEYRGDYENALVYLEHCCRQFEKPYPYYYTKRGSIYKKIDINMCVEYYEALLIQHPELKCYIEKELNTAKTQAEKGYVFKPKPVKQSDKNRQLEDRIHQAALQFV